MVDNSEILHDNCVEVLVKTDTELLPRGPVSRNVNDLSSFDKLIHAALHLDTDTLLEHNYSFHGKDVRVEHSYSSADRVGHRKTQSEDDLTFIKSVKWVDHSYFKYKNLTDWKEHHSSQEDLSHSDSYKTLGPLVTDIGITTQYRSNDSALDVTGFDTVSDKCLSQDSIHLKTVDVFTQPQINSGISDPDISKMTIASETETLSTSLPINPSNIGNIFDHTYSHKTAKVVDKDAVFDHTYNTSNKSHERRDSLPTTVGVKRGRSNEDLKVLYLKRQDFKKSPFLDQSYQLLEKNKTCRRHGSLKHRRKGKLSESDADECNQKHQKNPSCSDSKIFLDHSYGGIESAELRSAGSDKTKRIHRGETLNPQAEYKNDKSDHSYVIPKDTEISEEVYSPGALSDSGTESLNDEEEAEMSSTFERLLTCIAQSQDHNYVK